MFPMFHRNMAESALSLLTVHGCFSVDLRGEVAVHHRPLVVRSCAVCDQGLGAACRSFKGLSCRSLGVILDLLFFCCCAIYSTPRARVWLYFLLFYYYFGLQNQL